METKKKVVSEIQYMANKLRPFIETKDSKIKSKLLKYFEELELIPNPHALAWWSILTAITELLQAQESDITEKQKEYILHELCGAMGSFADFQLDENIFGTDATETNQKLNTVRKNLYSILKT
jgi:hypothetical protein